MNILRNQKDITLIMFIVIIGIIIGMIIFIANQGNTMANIEWGYMPSAEYNELRSAAAKSELYGNGAGTLSLESFYTLSKDVKKANGQWFKNSDVDFKTLIIDYESKEGVTLTDGKHVAIFIFVDGYDYVFYMFLDKEQIKNSNVLDEYLKNKSLLSGYKITIK